MAVIPARYASTRLPGKPLLPLAGSPMVEHVYRRARQARRVGRVLVATDDSRILEAVRGFGGDAQMTSSQHATGTDRIGELLPSLPEEVILNVQGDEPELDPSLLDRLVARLDQDGEVEVVTAATRWPAGVDPRDPNRVKVVLDLRNRALLFSRAVIPASRATVPGPTECHWPLLHLGVYAFRRAALERFLNLPRGPLEGLESLEQLRLLENGMSVGVVIVDNAPPGVDTAEDYRALVARLEGSDSGRSAGG